MPHGPGQGRGLAVLLVALALALLVPALLLGGLAVRQIADAYRGAAEGRLRDTAGALASAVDREIAGTILTLEAYATSPAFGPDPAKADLGPLYAQAQRVTALLGRNVAVGTADGGQIFSALAPLGTPLPHMASLGVAERVFATGRPAVGDLVVGSLTGHRLVVVGVPVRDARGQVVLQAYVPLESGQLHKLLAAQELPQGAVATVLDSKGVMVARSDGLQDGFIGQAVPVENRHRYESGEAGLFRGTGLKHDARVFAFHAVPSAPGWVVVVAQPEATFAAAWHRPLIGLGIGGMLALVGGGIAALLAARRILRPIGALAAHARALEAAEDDRSPAGPTAAALSPAGIAEIDELRLGFAAAEAALRRTAERLKLATAGAGVGTWELDLAADRGFCSPESMALLGRGRATSTAGDWLDAVHADDRAAIAGRWSQAVAAGGPFEVEFRAAAAPERWLLVRGRTDHDAGGRPLHCAGVMMDITARRRAEAALAEGERMLRLALDAAELGTWRWEVASGTEALEWDARSKALFALPPGAAADYAAWAAAILPEDRHDAEASVARALDPADPDDAYVRDFRVRHPDGTVRWLSACGRAQFEPDETAPAGRRIVRIIGTNRDITRRREAEAVLARDRAELERLVEARTRDLHATQVQLAHAQRMEALGQLAGGVAHDFNNVLQAVQGAARLIERRAGDPDKVRGLAAMITDAAERGGGITRRLLAFARRGDLRAEAVDPAGLLAGMAEILSHTLGGAIAVRVATRSGLPALLADKGQLETVLVNLAANARDAMPQGGTLTLAASAETVTATNPAGLRPGTYVRLAVADTGTGMLPEVLARITEPFFTTKPQGKGTGLGLAMARGFAEQSGGALAVESAPGRGTTVSLWLPLAAGAASGTGAGAAAGTGVASHRPAAPGGQSRILLVDDDAMVRMITGTLLEDCGHAVLEAESGAAALALLDAGETVDLLVSDLSMPGMDGLAVIRAAQQRRPFLPAILLTGYATGAAELAEEGGQGVSFALLRKPVPAVVLADCVAELLERVAAA